MLNLAWPWVSRRAYLAVVDERDGLRARVTALTDDIVRLARVEHGLPERKPDQKRPPAFIMPATIKNLLTGFGTPMIAQQVEYGIRQQLQAGADPAEVERALREQLGVAEA